ncbi:hypothetical protein MOA81_01510 [Bacillus spizizenii]|nr:hypothetical protein [Bacillus spizizenii]
MKEESILKALQQSKLIESDQPITEDLTCQEECEAKLAVAIAGCALIPNPIAQIACMEAARRAFDRCSDECES